MFGAHSVRLLILMITHIATLHFSVLYLQLYEIY